MLILCTFIFPYLFLITPLKFHYYQNQSMKDYDKRTYVPIQTKWIQLFAHSCWWGHTPNCSIFCTSFPPFSGFHIPIWNLLCGSHARTSTVMHSIWHSNVSISVHFRYCRFLVNQLFLPQSCKSEGFLDTTTLRVLLISLGLLPRPLACRTRNSKLGWWATKKQPKHPGLARNEIITN